MGNKFSVRNDTGEEVLCRVYPAGAEVVAKESRIPVGHVEVYKFGRGYSRVFIVSVEGKAVRAMPCNKIACLKQITEGEYIILAEDSATNIMTSSEEIIESNEMNVNWNSVKDSSVMDDKRKLKKENLSLMMALNKHIGGALGIMSGIMVAEVSGNKDAARLATKMFTDFFNSYLKISLPILKETENPLTIEKIDEIRQTLLAISRNLSFGYPYFRQSVNDDEGLSLNYLHKFLFLITGSHMLPFLEECNSEIAIPIYIFAIVIILDLLQKIREIKSNEITETEKTYVKVFANNLTVMWESILENIDLSSKIKLKGFCVKKATLTYKGQLIYHVKSIWKSRAMKRIENIKKEFIKNRKYQLEFLYNHPSDFVQRFSEN